MTLDKAQDILAEHGWQLVEIFAEADLVTAAYWIVATPDGKPVSKGKTWAHAFANATGEAPI